MTSAGVDWFVGRLFAEFRLLLCLASGLGFFASTASLLLAPKRKNRITGVTNLCALCDFDEGAQLDAGGQRPLRPSPLRASAQHGTTKKERSHWAQSPQWGRLKIMMPIGYSYSGGLGGFPRFLPGGWLSRADYLSGTSNVRCSQPRKPRGRKQAIPAICRRERSGPCPKAKIQYCGIQKRLGT